MTENLPEKKTTVFQDEDSLMLNKVVSETWLEKFELQSLNVVTKKSCDWK
jgi:hypothetical protein